MKKNKIKYILLIGILIFSFKNTFAQGDGARMLLWGPTGATGLIPKWMHLNQNITPANILVNGADLTINAFPVTLIHNFNLGGNFAQIMLNAVPGNVSGTLNAAALSNLNLPSTIDVSSGGFADGFIGFKYGLINQPALNVKEYVAYQHKTFSMMGYFRTWYSGSYDRNKAMNLGSNRFTFELGFPMNIHLSKDPKRVTWLEVYPSVQMYTTNSDPTFITRARETKQKPLFAIENHLTHNFTEKFWAGADLRYQYGGALEYDGVKQDNKINALGGGATVGYQIIPPLGINMSYAGVFSNPSNVDANMFKITAVFTYVNLKKLK
ncbi:MULTISPECIES: transporter [unclassified Flavobacterium]|jgi:hypothetical protein|uniref:transporter n=1 Tax=unclassified Flavobacterium TaxID=196869 RepID=UPI00064963A3|nr:transporter [Flavobacterium sp. ABG]KLT68345.1 hypothetical protein AB674_18060 [Flavobacterium sp. ABG]